MDKNPAIDFVEPKKKGFVRNESSNLGDTLNEVDFKSICINDRKFSEAKKVRLPTKSEEELRKQQIEVLFSFPISLKLLNLLRDPAINNQKFDQQYLIGVRGTL